MRTAQVGRAELGVQGLPGKEEVSGVWGEGAPGHEVAEGGSEKG